MPASARTSPSAAVTVSVASTGISGAGVKTVVAPVVGDSEPGPRRLQATAEASPATTAVSVSGGSPTVVSLAVAAISIHERFAFAGETEIVTVATTVPDDAVTCAAFFVTMQAGGA